MATKTKKHQNNISDEEILHSLINGEEKVSVGVLNSTYGNYARI
jgi:hypothetical protein